MNDRSLFTVDGLWERWASFEGDAIETDTIINTTAKEDIVPFYGRVAAVVPSSAPRTVPWIDIQEDNNHALGLSNHKGWADAQR